MSGRSVRQGLEAVGARRGQRGEQERNAEAYTMAESAFMVSLLKFNAAASC
jgi:hypothetical protein